MGRKNNNTLLGNNRDKLKTLLNKYSHLDQSSEYVGLQIKNMVKGCVITIVGWDGVSKSGKTNKKYTCHCSICSKDKELFCKDYLKIEKNNLLLGRLPCACAKLPKWTEEQNIIRVQRVCEGLGYIFEGWYDKYKGSNTKLKLYNPSTNHRWYSYKLSDFVSKRNIGDPSTKNQRIRETLSISEEDRVRQFLNTGVFENGTVFEHIKHKENKEGKRVYWKYLCPTCSCDEYVKAGVCNGWFETTSTALIKGTKSCRCGRNPRLSKGQCEYKLRKICKEENLTFLDFEGDYVGSGSFFKWVCNKGHTRRTRVVKFINDNSRCSVCRDLKYGNNGYYPERADEYPDYLYLPKFFFDDIADFIKCGRSFTPDDRFDGLRDDSGADYLENLYLWDGTHQEVYDTEQSIKEILYSEGLNYFDSDEEKLFAGSSECYFNTQEVIDKIVKLVEESPLTLVENNT